MSTLYIYNFTLYWLNLFVQSYFYYINILVVWLFFFLKKKIFFYPNQDFFSLNANIVFSNNIFLIHSLGIIFYFLSLCLFFSKIKYTSRIYCYGILFLLGGIWSQQELIWGGWWNWDFLEIYFFIWSFIYIYIIHINYKNFFFPKIQVILYNYMYFLVLKFNLFWSIHNFILYIYFQKLSFFIIYLLIYNNLFISVVYFIFFIHYINFKTIKYLVFIYIYKKIHTIYYLYIHKMFSYVFLCVYLYNIWNQYLFNFTKNIHFQIIYTHTDINFCINDFMYYKLNFFFKIKIYLFEVIEYEHWGLLIPTVFNLFLIYIYVYIFTYKIIKYL